MATTRNSNKLLKMRADNLTTTSPLSPSLLASATSDILNTKFDSLRELIAADVCKAVLESENRIMEKIGAVSAELDNFKRSFIALEQRVLHIESANADIDNMRAEIIGLREMCTALEEEKFLSDVVVSGVPYTIGENLPNIFDNFCQVLELNCKPRDCFRAKSKNNLINNAPIIYKLNSPHERVMLLQSMAKLRKEKKRALKLADFAIAGDNNVSIYESLSNSKREIFELAVKHKRNGKFVAAYSFRGKIYVKLCQGSSPLLVSDLKRVKELANGK